MSDSSIEGALLQEIGRLVALMTTIPVTPSAICDYNKSRHQIISNSRNIYPLINILQANKDLPNQIVLEILKMIIDLISIIQTGYDLHELMEMIKQIPINDNSLIQTFGKMISLISKLIFLSNNFELNFPFDQSMTAISPLELFVFTDFLNYFSMLCLKQPKVEGIKQTIKTQLIPILIAIGIRILPEQPNESVSLLCTCLSFATDPKKIGPKAASDVISQFYPPDIFKCFAQIVVSPPNQPAIDALRIVTVLSRCSHQWGSCYHQIVENIQNFILAILADPNILNEPERTLEIQNLLRKINPEYKAHPFDSIIEFLYQFTQTVLSNSPLQLTIIYPGILVLFKNFKGHQSSRQVKNQLLESLKPAFIHYVELLLSSLENYTEQSLMLFQPESFEHLEKSLTYLLEFSVKEEATAFLLEKASEIIKTQPSLINSFKISFLMIVLNVFFENMRTLTNDINVHLFDFFFGIIPEMKERIVVYRGLCKSENDAPFLIPQYYLRVVKTFIQKTFINLEQIEDQKTIFDKIAPESKFQDQIENLNEIFALLLFLLDNDIDSHLTKEVIRTILDTPSLCKEITKKEELAGYFIENYVSMPCKVIYYYILCKFATADECRRGSFASSLAGNLMILIDNKEEEGIDRFFKIISTFFDSYLRLNHWYRFYIFLYDTFGDKIIEVSNSPYWNYILKFILKLTEYKNGKDKLTDSFKNFQSTSPHTFRSFQFFCQLLTNIMKQIALKEIVVDESLFLSSVPTSDVYSNAVTLMDDQDDGDWNSFAEDVRAMNNFMKSPFPNFDIMRYYNDKCIFEYFDVFIEQVQHSSPLSFLSMPKVFEPITFFIYLLTKVATDEVLLNQKYALFVLNIAKICFLSNNITVQRNGCGALSALCHHAILNKDFTVPLAQVFSQHFVLTLNLLTTVTTAQNLTSILESDSDLMNSDDSSFENQYIERDNLIRKAKSFLYWFLCGKTDFYEQLCQAILGGIEVENVRKGIEEALGSLMACAQFSKNKEDKIEFLTKSDDSFNHFYRYSFRLDYLPTIAEFFKFK